MIPRLALVLLLSPALVRAQADPPLVAAVKNGDLADLKALLVAGTDLGARDQYGWTAVMWAAHGGWTDAVSALLAAGTPSAPPSRRSSPSNRSLVPSPSSRRGSLSKSGSFGPRPACLEGP
jgi:ankyrin repeat protein